MKGLLQLHPSNVLMNLRASSRDELLFEMAEKVAGNNPAISANSLYQALLDRESLGSTGIGHGIAIPHCKSPALKVPVILFGRSESPIEFNSPDDRPVRLFFLIVSPEDADSLHLQLLSTISRILKAADVRNRFLDASSADEIVSILIEQGGSGDRHKSFN